MTAKENNNNTHLLRVGVIFLAIVSFFTTANGMKEYIFTNHGGIAYAASAAIQSILLALSMNLPGYLRGIWEKKWRGVIRVGLCVISILLSFVTMFISSWFSYVYIADIVHQDSWGAESELLVQQTYRSELYDARDYAHVYRVFLEENMGEKILLLEEQAGKLFSSGVDFTMDWDAERSAYVDNNGIVAASYMTTVIDAMEKALRENASQEDLDLAAEAVTNATVNITTRMETIPATQETVNSNITNYNNQIARLTTLVNNATEDTDVAGLTAAINNYTQLLNRAVQQQADLATEYAQLDSALQRLQVYENRLNLNSSTGVVSIRGKLIQMQSEFFKQDPDEAVLLQTAQEIFDDLRKESHQLAGSEENGDEGLSYTELMIQMNRLIQNLTDYSEIKNIESSLEGLITELRAIDKAAENAPADQDGETSTETDHTSAEIDESQNTDSIQEDQWQTEWGRRLDELKAQISAMPIYSVSEESEDGTSDIISGSQMNILIGYDRKQSSKTLDDMIRRYIANHSAIYQGIIYLQSPYRTLALFALFLAFSFDLAGFVFGFVIQGNPQQENDPQVTMGGPNSAATSIPGAAPVSALSSALTTHNNSRVKWSVLKQLHQYMVLTGDYESRDGKYYYQAFKSGVLYQWLVQDASPYMRGIYIQNKNMQTKGQKVEQAQELLFSTQNGGPADGIYLDGQLTFDEGSLILEQQGQKRFLASVDEYVPVHSYNPDRGENQTIPAKKLGARSVRAEIAVVALNEKGTRVAAIYMIEK